MSVLRMTLHSRERFAARPVPAAYREVDISVTVVDCLLSSVWLSMLYSVALPRYRIVAGTATVLRRRSQFRLPDEDAPSGEEVNSPRVKSDKGRDISDDDDEEDDDDDGGGGANNNNNANGDGKGSKAVPPVAPTVITAIGVNGSAGKSAGAGVFGGKSDAASARSGGGTVSGYSSGGAVGGSGKRGKGVSQRKRSLSDRGEEDEESDSGSSATTSDSSGDGEWVYVCVFDLCICAVYVCLCRIHVQGLRLHMYRRVWIVVVLVVVWLSACRLW